MIAETFEVLVKVQDVDARALCGSGYCQIGDGKAMGAL
jgi:hypothetical protein